MIVEAPTLLGAVNEGFRTASTGRELGLQSADVDDATLIVVFSGSAEDRRGPFGARISIPRDASDPEWTRWGVVSGLEEWVMYAVVQRIAEEYLTGGAERGSRDADGTLWLQLS
ncbi:hypothetical protein SAMN04489860_2366 [Paraoerskovia marina]|uniref:Uncharacterized protein n=1 Tax=Paraoerskovia marina TaxID=545619 RepID=A0A1H1V1V7_9CELL|nr:hypothetical protein [Paraoerskovia marina]SDS78663.1 hypothetical protein SAMN04489860_2366 [Paraoerskovia marina]